MTKRILVPTDFSTASQQALDYAIEFSRTLKAELILLHAVEPAYFTGATGVYGVGFDSGLVQQQIESAAREQLARLAARLKEKRLAVRTALSLGPPAGAITAAAGKLKPDLIVMATHGRTGLSHALLGSVAERVVRTAPCPVLTIPPKRTAASPKRTAAARRAPVAAKRAVGSRAR